MKKLSLYIASFIFIFVISITMLACDFSASPSADYNNSPSENVEFLISYQSSSDYTISLNKSYAKCGETIYLNIEMLSKGLAIEYVKANDEFCTPILDNFYNYSFTMPSKNVQITLSLKQSQLLIWTGSPITKLAASNQSQSYEFSFLQPIEITSITKQIALYSSNPSCIPSSAIQDISLIASSDNSKFIGGKFNIDLSQINLGTTTLSLHITSLNPYCDCTISLEIEVVDTSHKLTFDFSAINAKEIMIDIINLDTGEYFSYTTTQKYHSIDIACQTNNSIIVDVYYLSQNGNIIGVALPNISTANVTLDNGLLVFLEDNAELNIVC